VAVSDGVGVASEELLPTTAPMTPMAPAKQLAASNSGSATMRIFRSGRIGDRGGGCVGLLSDISGPLPASFLSTYVHGTDRVTGTDPCDLVLQS
jgi:hypothetical protein